jgi:hypothetical protein
MSESKRLGRRVAVDMVKDAGITNSDQYLAIQALRGKGPPFTYGPHGTEYDPDAVREWIAKEKARQGKK